MKLPIFSASKIEIVYFLVSFHEAAMSEDPNYPPVSVWNGNCGSLMQIKRDEYKYKIAEVRGKYGKSFDDWVEKIHPEIRDQWLKWGYAHGVAVAEYFDLSMQVKSLRKSDITLGGTVAYTNINTMNDMNTRELSQVLKDISSNTDRSYDGKTEIYLINERIKDKLEHTEEEIEKICDGFPYLKHLFDWDNTEYKDEIKYKEQFNVFDMVFNKCTLKVDIGRFQKGEKITWIRANFVEGTLCLCQFGEEGSKVDQVNFMYLIPEKAKIAQTKG